MLLIFIILVAEGNGVGGIFTLRSGEAQLKAYVFTHEFLNEISVFIILIVLKGTIVNLEDAGSFLAIQPRTTIGENISLGTGISTALGQGNINGITSTPEVSITQANHTYKAIRAAITSTYTEDTSILLGNINLQNAGIWLYTSNRLYIYRLKEVQISQALIAADYIVFVQRLAYLWTQLPQNNLFLSFFQALDFEALQNTFIYLDNQLAVVANFHITDFGHNIAVLDILLLECTNILLQGKTIQTIPLLQLHLGQQLVGRLNLSIAIQLYTGNNRCLKEMIGDNYTLWYRLKGRIQIIEITSAVDIAGILRQKANGANITWLGNLSQLYSLHNIIADTLVFYIHDSIALNSLHGLVQLFISRTVLGPYAIPAWDSCHIGRCRLYRAFIRQLQRTLYYTFAIHSSTFAGIQIHTYSHRSISRIYSSQGRLTAYTHRQGQSHCTGQIFVIVFLQGYNLLYTLFYSIYKSTAGLPCFVPGRW